MRDPLLVSRMRRVTYVPIGRVVRIWKWPTLPHLRHQVADCTESLVVSLDIALVIIGYSFTSIHRVACVSGWRRLEAGLVVSSRFV